MFVKVSIVVPTFNESKNIESLVKEIKTNVPKIEIVIVDDNSPDGTGKLADNISRKTKNVVVVHRYDKKGLGSAILDGFEASHGDVVGVIDADFSHPPFLLPKMIEKIDEGYDLVIGSRYVKDGGIENWQFTRRIVSKTAIKLSRFLTNVKDPVSGFFLVKKSSIKDVKLSSRSWKVLLDIIVKGKYSKAAEIPFIFTTRKEGKSKIAAKEYMNYILHLAELSRFKVCRAFGRR